MPRKIFSVEMTVPAGTTSSDLVIPKSMIKASTEDVHRRKLKVVGVQCLNEGMRGTIRFTNSQDCITSYQASTTSDGSTHTIDKERDISVLAYFECRNMTTLGAAVPILAVKDLKLTILTESKTDPRILQIMFEVSHTSPKE